MHINFIKYLYTQCLWHTYLSEIGVIILEYNEDLDKFYEREQHLGINYKL